MPILRLNAMPDLRLQQSGAYARLACRRAASGAGPIISTIHGFKYEPDAPLCCPHGSIFASDGDWITQLGFARARSDEGLVVAFGWTARGLLWDVARRARAAGAALAEAIAIFRRGAPHRPVHIITHSMASEVALEALNHLAAGDVARLLTLTLARYQSREAAALRPPAGGHAELFNVTSAENDVFDAMYEWLVSPPKRRDRALGAGIQAQNAVTVQIGCPETLRRLARLSGPIAPRARRICHWSCYTRPSLLRLYNRALRHPRDVPLRHLQTVLPEARSPRFARLWGWPSGETTLPALEKRAS